MTITEHISIDLQQPGNAPMIHAVQGDTYTREVQISLYAAGVAWELPEGHDVAIRYSKPDGTAGIYDKLPDDTTAWSSDGNTVTVILCPQMLTCPGKVPAQVAIIHGENLVSTFAFVVDVEADPSKGAVKSEKYNNWRYAFLPQISGAKVGQYFRIAKVDADGRVVELEAVDDPAAAAMQAANNANNTAGRNADDIEYLSKSKLPQVSNAKVGQYLKITEVNEVGQVVAFEPVDAPAAGAIDGDLDMKGHMIDNIGTLSLAGPNGDATDGAWMAIDDVIDNEDGTRNPVINHYSNESDSPVILRNIAPGVEDRDAANVGQLRTKLPQPANGVKVGDYLQVAEVSEDGKKVLKLIAVDAPSGGSGSNDVFIKTEEGETLPSEILIDLSVDEPTVLVEAPATAEVGQTIVVKAVDETGKPTEWETVSVYTATEIDTIMGSYITDINILIGGDS
jgi:hypothetical protein